MRTALPWAALAALCLAACGDSRLSGSEVTNPPQKIAGAVRDASGAAVAGARVSAYPADFDPVADSGSARKPGWTALTDARGGYRIDTLDTGVAYNVFAESPRGRALVRGVRPDTAESARVPDAVVAGHGALSILIHDSLPAGKAYVYLAGTPLSADLQALGSEPGYVILDSVPAGPIPKLYHRVKGAAGARTLLAQDVVVRAGDTVPVGLYPGWKHSRLLRLNTTASGVPLSADPGAFPLLVRLDSASLDFSQARSDGADLRFARSNGIPLPYEIETWNAAARSAAVWVRLPSVAAGDSLQSLRMYWGNPGAASESRGPAVFDSSFRFGGVWHLNAVGTGTPPEYHDASARGNTGFAGDYATGMALAPTPFGIGMRQNGTRSALYTSQSFKNPGHMTLSIWFRTTTDSGGLLLGMNKWQPNADTSFERDRHIWMDDSGYVHFGIAWPDGKGPFTYEKHVLSTPFRCNDGKWHRATGMMGPDGMTFWLDGARMGNDPVPTIAQNYIGYWRMGFAYPMGDWKPTFKARYFRGELDEGRVALRTFPEDWVKLDYGSQREGAKLIRFE